jgi:hypothetical protein
MTDFTLSLITSAVLIAGLTIISLVALRGWSQWIDFRKLELEGLYTGQHRSSEDPAASTGSRIELADLRERVKKLEAIAAGVDI